MKTMGPAPTASDLKKHVGFWLRFVSNHVSHAFARKLLNSGVTVAEWVVLREMYGLEAIAPSLLADLTGMTRGAASKLVERLVAKKLVTRKGRQDDRRFQEIALTAAAQQLVPALCELADQNDVEYFAPLSKNERNALVATLKKLVKAHNLHALPLD
ncbi:MAG TPA: MarR family winged helix-turn-helix transcriptional regulator [Tepidisphaeraceae bacterium]|jgi:DNA-binding MarR family transcriptional regulator|nr:MarR family winged helix-turn-helix transcriptional regulator [Tepidisphaeraceae bacterium]